MESYPFYIEVDPEGDFDIEYLGGQWHEELIDCVQFFLPASDGNKLGVVEVWGSGCAISAVRGRPEAARRKAFRAPSLAPTFRGAHARGLAAGFAALAIPPSVQADTMKLQLTVNDNATTATLIGNLSKSGASLSLGRCGAHVTVDALSSVGGGMGTSILPKWFQPSHHQ